MDKKEIESLIKWWKETDTQGMDIADYLFKPLMNSFGNDVKEILAYLHEMDIEDLDIMRGCFEEIYGKFMSDDVYNELGALENKLDRVLVMENLTKRIQASVSPFHTVQYALEELKEYGFEEIKLEEKWQLERGKKYVVKLYQSTLAAFSIGDEWQGDGFRFAAAHTDFPCLKIKPSAEIKENNYLKVNVEVYGGPILNTWLDRPLSAAGRVVLKSDNIMEPKIKLVDLKEPLFLIPNLAIHMNRDVNKGVELNRQKDMLPVLTTLENLSSKDSDKGSYLLSLLTEQLKVEKEEILDYDLFLYPIEQPSFVGAENALYSAGRLDNITSVQACVNAIHWNGRKDGINMVVLFDSEEVGSSTKQGAGSNLIQSLIHRIYNRFGMDRETLECALASAMGLSVDVAHAIHPNASEKSDITNKVYLNKGFAVKTSASERYASDIKVIGALMQLCEKYQIPYQRYVNRSDMAGGSTLGAIAVSNLPIRMLDIGVPILAMHSARETMGADDQLYLEQFVTRFLQE